MEQNGEPRNKLLHLWVKLPFNKCAGTTQGEKQPLQQMVLRKTRYPHAKKEFAPLLYTTCKRELKMN